MTKSGKKTWDTVIDDTGVEHTDENEINLVWESTYENLGKENINDENFDKEFAQTAEEQIRSWEHTSQTYKKIWGLEDKIKVEEVHEVVKKLALGKAGGKDEIVNEIIKYGGEKC